MQATYAAATVPTDLQRQGIFQTTTGAPVPLRNPITGAVYANGIVPQSDWTPLATLVIGALPLPTSRLLQQLRRRSLAPRLPITRATVGSTRS